MDHFGFSYATLFIVSFGVILIVVSAVFYSHKAITKRKRRDGYAALSGDDNAEANTGTNNYGSIDGNEDSNRRSPSIGYNSGSGSDPSSPETLRGGASQQQRSLRVGSRGSAIGSNPLSPKSPFRTGPTSMLGGVLGFSVPFR